MNTVKAFYTKYIKPWVKALASAVGGAIAGLLINWAQGTTPIPTTRKELYTVLIAAVLPALLALFAPPNKITQKQLDKDPNVVGGVVVPDVQVPPPVSLPPVAPPSGGTYPSSWS